VLKAVRKVDIASLWTSTCSHVVIVVIDAQITDGEVEVPTE